MTSDRDRSRRRSGVFRLNQGSSPFGRTSTFRLNQPGGTFGAGHPAGGGAGAGVTLANALMGPAASVTGQAPVEGPPPSDLSSPPPLFSSEPTQPTFHAPAFDPQPVYLGPSSFSGVQPTFDPSIITKFKPAGGSSSIKYF